MPIFYAFYQGVAASKSVLQPLKAGTNAARLSAVVLGLPERRTNLWAAAAILNALSRTESVQNFSRISAVAARPSKDFVLHRIVKQAHQKQNGGNQKNGKAKAAIENAAKHAAKKEE